ncbi:biotin/lipoyl-containing protein, partial [Bordetella bronchiseptica]
MAITDVLVPQLSESVSEATLLTWKKQAGAAVEADEILIEIETDKVVLEVPAPSSSSMAMRWRSASRTDSIWLTSSDS